MPGKAAQVAPEPQADSTETCSFWCLHADFVRKYPGKKLPFFQELRNKHPEALVQVTISYAQVVTGALVEDSLSVSHRWMVPNDPDPDGEQLKAIKAFLHSDSGKKIKRVWIDSACMPQDQPEGSRSMEDTAAFKVMLGNVNMLFLGMTVLILLDLSYVSRFWTQFEAWLSMQFAMPDGLKPAVGTANARHHIVCVQNAAAQSELFTKDARRQLGGQDAVAGARLPLQAGCDGHQPERQEGAAPQDQGARSDGADGLQGGRRAAQGAGDRGVACERSRGRARSREAAKRGV